MDATAVPAFFWSVIVPLSLQALLLLAAAAVADRLLPQRAWPELRLAVGTVLLLKLLLPPRLGSPIPWTHPLASWTGTLQEGAAPWSSEAVRPWALAAGWIWLAGAAAGLALLAFAALHLRRQWRRAAPASVAIVDAAHDAARRLGLRRVPDVRLLAGIPSPFVFGLLAPRILLPAGITPGEAAHALVHETAHVRRKDLAFAALVALIRAAYWFHPFVHGTGRRLGELREICCDRSVARALGAETTHYRRTLLSFAERRHRSVLAALPMMGGASLLVRLRALDALERDRPRLRRALTLASASLALACAIPLAPAAERRAESVAELVTRPPGCLQLRYMVLRRLAEEQSRPSPVPPESP